MFPVQFITPEMGPYLRRVQIAKLPSKLFFTNRIFLVPKTPKRKKYSKSTIQKNLRKVSIAVSNAISIQNSAQSISASFSTCYLSYVSTHCTFNHLCVLGAIIFNSGIRHLERPCLTNCLQNKYVTVFNPFLFIFGLSC